MRIPIHREGWPFIGFAAILNFLLFKLLPPVGWAFLPVTAWVIAFFRDPERKSPPGDGLVSPADGRLLPVVEAPPPTELGLGDVPRTRLSIFMNVFNVHVNRSPCNGTVTGLAYRPGRFFNAAFDKASEHNERMAIALAFAGPDGAEKELVVVQIAGLVARRIHCDLVKGQRVCRGDRFGIIRFGSRLDVYLPPGARVCVSAGQSVKAGETILADFPS